MNRKIPKKIIYTWNYIEWGGVQIYTLALIKEVKKHTEVLAVIPEGSHPQLLKLMDERGIPYEFFKGNLILDRGRIALHRSMKSSEKAMLDHLKKVGLEDSIVHLDIAPWQSFASLKKLLSYCKVVYTMHNALPEAPSWREFLWRKKFERISRYENFAMFSANKHSKESLRGLLPERFRNGITVTYVTFDPQEIDAAIGAKIEKGILCDKYGIPKDKFLVFCVGQFIDRKGRWLFLDAARELANEYKDIAFIWISNSKPSDNDRKRIESYGLGGDFRLISSEEVGDERQDLFILIGLADVFALPSYMEGLPISIIEAMALKKAIVTTNINAIPEAIIHRKTGLLTRPGDREALISSIRELKENEALRYRLAEEARNFALENFNEEGVGKIAWQAYLDHFNGSN